MEHKGKIQTVSTLIGSAALGIALALTTLLVLSGMAVKTAAQETSTLTVLGTGNTIRAQDTYSTAYVVVEFTDGTSSARMITFTEPIWRIAALKLAGFAVEHAGDLVANIEGDGCSLDDMWCPTNNWWQGGWSNDMWDSTYGGWPPANLIDGDIIGFHNGAAWQAPSTPGSTYAAVADGFAWLAPRQNAEDGSYPSGWGSKVGPSLDMALAVAANSQDPDTWRRDLDSPSLIGYVTGPDGRDYAGQDASAAGKMAVALAAAQVFSDSSGGVCWPGAAKTLEDYYHPESGTFYEGSTNQAGVQTWAMLGWEALGKTVPVTAVNALKDMANADGGWNWSQAYSTDSDSMVTAQAIQALLQAGVPVSDQSIQDGLSFLKGAQNDDGGFAYSVPGASDVDATAYAIQAIVAAGQDPIAGTWQTINGIAYSSPITYLLSLQTPDGSFPAYDTQMATEHVLPSLLQRPFPLAVAEVPECPALYLPFVHKAN